MCRFSAGREITFQFDNVSEYEAVAAEFLQAEP